MTSQRYSLLFSLLLNFDEKYSIFLPFCFVIECEIKPLALELDIPKGPIACFAATDTRLLCGYGMYVVELRTESLRKTRHWKVGQKTHNNVSSIAISKNIIFASCREEHCIKVYDSNKILNNPNTIDCYEILKHYDNMVKPRDCRAISMAIVERSNLWIGCKNGYIIILDTTVTLSKVFKPLDVISRNKAAVRSITVTPRIGSGSSSVITSGQGFRSWSAAQQQQKDVNKDELDGYVLVWDAELPKQKKHMRTEHRKRKEMAAEMACE